MIATGVLWLAAAVWIDLGARREVERVLDNRLQDAAHMVSTLAASGRLAADGGRGAPVILPDATPYMHQLSCQIWSFNDQLVAQSGGAPETKLAAGGSGFSEREINGERWRVYALEDSAKGFRVLVGDRLTLREGLVAELIKGLLWPAILILPLLALAIWGSVTGALRPLRLIAQDIAQRDGDNMRALDARAAPEEIRPLAAALNSLFAKVETARRHEREITAFAAHELRTPLAGIKAQAQIAVAAADPELRAKALRQILRGVDRTARLVTQLLALARLDSESAAPAPETIEIGAALEEIVELCRAAGPEVEVRIDRKLHGARLVAPGEPLTLLLRNLTENALQHTPPNGTVEWRLSENLCGVELHDQGPGAPEAELPLLTRRFFRGARQTAPGSGLGLTIAELAAARCRATLSLNNRTDRRGLTAKVLFERGVICVNEA